MKITLIDIDEKEMVIFDNPINLSIDYDYEYLQSLEGKMELFSTRIRINCSIVIDSLLHDIRKVRVELNDKTFIMIITFIGKEFIEGIIWY